jgi:hypothetical protein
MHARISSSRIFAAARTTLFTAACLTVLTLSSAGQATATASTDTFTR